MRRPIVAGQFYEADSQKLNKQIETAFENGPGSLPISKREKNVLAAIVPHAGYQFSAKCAAWAYKEIGESKFPDLYILLGVNHSGLSDKALISTQDWDTPLGTIKTDKDVANKLCSDMIKIDNESHLNEHSIEVQLPFLQFVSRGYLDSLKILPIIINTQNYSKIQKIAESIAKIQKKFSIITSSDFTHFGVNYGFTPFRFNIKEEVTNLDKKAIELILQLKTKSLLEYIGKTEATICGIAPIALTLEILKKLNSKKGELLCYYNSGDITKDYSNFVGYASIVFER